MAVVSMSAKFNSTHFTGTNGSTEELMNGLFGSPDEPTATVWGHIEPTQPNYEGTQIPRSFIVATPSEKFWTHGNATKHMNEFVATLKDEPRIAQSNPSLLSQFVLYDYRKSLIGATKNGTRFNRIVKSGHWEFRFSRSKGDKHTVIVHALFKGFN